MSQQGSFVASIMPFILMFAIFYFLLIRPQQQQQRRRREMLAGLRKGNLVVTIGGIYGEIVDIKEDTITLRIADKVNVKLARSAVGRVIGKEAERQDHAEK